MSKKLSFCLKAVKTLNDDDLGALTDSIEAYVRGGMTTEQAEAAAIIDVQAQVERERTELVGLLRSQHADLFSATRPRPLGSTAKFENNKVFTADKVQAARARMRSKLGRTNAGLDPEMLVDGIMIAGGHIEAGARKFADFARVMVDDLGEEMRPYLLSFYEGVRYYPGFDNAGMSTAAEALEAHNSLVAPDAKEQDDGPDNAGAEGARPLDEVAPEESAVAQGAGEPGGSDPGGSVTSAKSNDRADRPRVSRARSGGSGSTSVRAPAPRGRGKAGALGTPGAGAEGDGVPTQRVGVPVSVANLPAVNFRITPDVRLGKGGEVEKFNDNIAAIKTLQAIEAEGRRATPDEQRKLARYVGWGGLANAFPKKDKDTGAKVFNPEWKARGEELEQLLTPNEYATARNSTQAAHYTSEKVVSAMWDAARRLGFKGGLALESSMGSGNFLGLMPDALVGNTRFVGVEYDPITSRIAGALYPQETVINSGFQDVPLVDNVFDLNIGNPPFGANSLNFQFKPELRGASIHNQFFRAALDAVKPGGLQVGVVSRFLMDKIDPADRIAMAKKARLLGAIRLPDSAFQENARTQVVTDILFFQKLTESEQAEMEAAFDARNSKQGGRTTQAEDQEHQRLVALVPKWTQTVKVADPLGGDDIVVNGYFKANPGMVMGTLERSGSMQHGADVTVRMEKGADLAALLDAAIARLPANVMSQTDSAVQASLERYASLADALKLGASGMEAGAIMLDPDGKLQQVLDRETPEGGFELSKRELTETSPWSDTLLQAADGRWYTLAVATDADGKPVKATKNGKATKRNVYERKYFDKETDISAGLRLGATRLARLKELVGLRDLFVAQINLETQDAVDKMEGNRAKLAAAYQAFTGKHGWVSEPANSALVADMPDGALVQALELEYRPALSEARAKVLGEKPRAAEAVPAPILKQRVIPKYEPPTRADTAPDALAITLSEGGRVDMERIADLLGKPESEAADELTGGAKPLVFKDPETGKWETAGAYLSGNVRRKLIAARSAGMTRNADALEAVQPEAWTAEQVTALLGSTWTPPKVYEAFFEHLTGTKPRIIFSSLTNTFTVVGATSSRLKNDEWGAEGMKVEEIIEAMLNTRPVRVYDRTDDGPKLNHDKTALAQLKAKMIETEYADWVYADGDRRRELVDIFNEKFNTRVTRQFDGSHLVLPGKVPDAILKLRRHQNNGIWRGIYERTVLYDHVVGAGKTYTAIARAMERRRMGLSRKPTFVVPNHLVEEWAAQAYRLYPGAKILAATKKDFERSRRRKLFAKVASGDWDMVIMAHSSFNFIGIAPETEARFLEAELKLAEKAIKEAEDAAAESGQTGFRKPFGVKEAERLRDKIQARLDKVKGADKKDRLLTFEQMGIDDLTVDEAHEFKNLFYSSRLTDVKGMGNKTGSQKAFDLYNKIRVLLETPTGSVAFLTGTPISNSAVEMYNVMRYLVPDQLAELGLEHFDAWRAMFVSTDPGWEANETGRLKEVNRLGRTWSNMRSLMELYYSFTDSVSNADIEAAFAADNGGAKFPLPVVKGGDRQSIIIEPTPAQQSALEDVIEGFDGLPGITDPYERNIARLRLMDRARKLSLDVRAAHPNSASRETGGKLEVLSEHVKRLYDATTADKGTQIIFLDRSVPKAKGDDKIIAGYDAALAEREAALQAGDETAYRVANDKLDGFNANEVEALRNAQNGGWNAYQQIKDNLVASGIPAGEIRFIQEAANDAQKQALFDAVNAGEVRVIIGSTQRMGAGTNIQKRLVGLHHGDVTWKPSDIEQREGRIIRQGNLFATPPELSPGGVNPFYKPGFEVEILAYATERTIDAKMWGLNSAKMRTINGIRKYDGVFTMEFEDAESVSMAEMAALASGDPLLLERVQIDSEINKLEMLERQHRRKARGIEDAIDSAKADIKNLPPRIEAARDMQGTLEAIEAYLAERQAARRVTVEGVEYSKVTEGIAAARAAMEVQQGGNKNARYSITVDGKKHTTKDGFEEAIHEAMGDASPFEMSIDGTTYLTRTGAARDLAQRITEVAQRLANGGSEQLQGDFTFAGQRLEVDVATDHGGGSFWAEFTTVDGQGRTLASSRSSGRADFEFTTQILLAPLRDMRIYSANAAHQLDFMKGRLAEAQKSLPELEGKKGGEFPQAAELKQKRERLEEVIRLLASDKPAAVPEADAAETGIAADMPDLSIQADFQETESEPVPEIVSTEPAAAQDIETAAAVERAVRSEVPFFRGLRLTALPQAPKPAEGDSPVVVQRYAASQLFEKVYGKRTVWFSANMPFANGIAPTGDPNAIMANEATTRPVMALLGHEMLHRLRGDRPDLYTRLHGRLMDLVREPGRYADQLAARYRKGGMEALPEGKMQEELIADIVGDFHTEPQFWRDLARTQGGSFRRVLAAIRDFWDALLRKLRSERPFGTEQYLTDIEAARAAVVEVMGEYAGNRQRAEAAETADAMSFGGDPFYSELAHQVTRSAMNSGTADSWRQLLKSFHTKGVKADEIAWTGIEDWLTLQTGKVSRDQVMDYLKANGVQVTETVLGGGKETTEKVQLEEQLRAAGFHLNEEYGEGVLLDRDGTPYEFDEDREGWFSVDDENVRLPRNLNAVTSRLMEITSDPQAAEAGEGETIYGQYTLPGGENYREVLLTLPPKAGPAPLVWTVERMREKRSQFIDDMGFAPETVDAAIGYTEEAGSVEDALRVTDARVGSGVYKKGTPLVRDMLRGLVVGAKNKNEADKPATFHSSHWQGHPNVLAHIRVNDRTDADGKRVLFVEEIQSDWAQIGKKGGFRETSASTAKVEAELAAAEHDAFETWEAEKSLHNKAKGDWQYWIEKKEKVVRDLRSTDEDIAEVSAKVKEALDSINHHGNAEIAARRAHQDAQRAQRDFTARQKSAPAPAPFVTKTDAWVSLAIKRIVKMAVDGGYDRVAFVNGEQSAERYSLEKHISKVRWDDATSGGIGSANLDSDEGRGILYAYDKSGTLVMERSLDASQIDDHVGKEVAQRLLAAPRESARSSGGTGIRRRSLSGLELKVGGEGMKAFYDQIVPKVAKEVLRKLGGQMGATSVVSRETIRGNEEYTYSTLTELRPNGMPDYSVLRVDTDEVAAGPFKTWQEANDWVMKNDPVLQTQQLAFDITPAMREKAAGGLPMFSLPPDPVLDSAMRKAGIDRRSRLRRIGDKVRAFYPALQSALRSNWGKQFQQGVLDQFTGIRMQPELQGLLPDQDPYVAARLANGGTSSVMRGLLLHGQAQWAKNGQHMEKKPGTKGLLEILEPLGGDLNDFFAWMVGNRAARLKTEGRENNLSDEEIQKLRDLNKGKEALFRRTALDYAAFKRSVLDIAQEAGLIDPEGRKVWDQADYIPFYREMDRTGMTSGMRNTNLPQRAMAAVGKKGLEGQSAGIRTLKGGTDILNDPMENILQNFSRLIDASLKNNALRKTVDHLVAAGSDVVEKVGYDMGRQLIPADQVRKRLEEFGTPDALLNILPAGAMEGMAKMWAIQPPSDPSVVRMMVGGKPQFYRVNDPMLLKSLTSFVPFDFPGLGVLRAFKRVLTAAVTSTPEFMARNFIRDTAASQMIGREAFSPHKSLAGIAKSFSEKGGFEAMLFAGASFQSGQINGADPEATGRAVRRMLRKKGFSASSASAFVGSIADTPAKFWDKYRHLGESIENANREAIYEATLKKRGDLTAAAYEAKDLMDFTLRGSHPIYQFFADVLPFFNARVQGLYRAGRANPKRLAAYGMVMLIASVALAMENMDNPEYEELPDWDKDTYWHFWTAGKHFRIPKPFELGVIFATIPERVMRYAKGRDSGKKLLERLWANIRDQLAFDPVPQAFRPMANVWANKDTFRDRPIESLGDLRKPASQRYNGLTSPTARELVEALNVGTPGNGAMDKLGLSPKKLEYLVGGYLGTAGLYALSLSDMAVNYAIDAPPKPAPRLDDIPLIRTFYREAPARATVYESELYEMRHQAAEVYAALQAQAKAGNPDYAAAIRDGNRELLGARKTLEHQAKLLTDLGKMRDQILASRTMTPKEKRAALDSLQVKRNQLTRETMTQPVIKAMQ